MSFKNLVDFPAHRMLNPDRNRGQQSESEWNEITEDLTDRFHCAFGEGGATFKVFG